MHNRWVQLNDDKTEVIWGDLKTRKLTSSVKLEDVTGIDVGCESEVFRSFTFKPHDEWLCFSLIADGRSIDFAAAKQSDLANWFCGLSELLQPGRGVSNGKLQWRVLQMKMRAELSSEGAVLTTW